jgi:molybdopterin-containing oxidoreductase family membrane subunit
VPTPIGEIYEYTPSVTELMVSLGIWAIGLLLFTLLAKAALPVQCRFLRGKAQAAGGPTRGLPPLPAAVVDRSR